LLSNQGLLAIVFFEASAFIVLLVLFLALQVGRGASYFRVWLAGWLSLTFSAFSELAWVFHYTPATRIVTLLSHLIALLAFWSAALWYVGDSLWRKWPLLRLASLTVLVAFFLERNTPSHFGSVAWGTAAVESILCVWAGWRLWRAQHKQKGLGTRMLAGALLVMGLHGLDRPEWPSYGIFPLRMALDHLLGVALGISMVVLVLESARSRSDELNEKLHRLTLLTAAKTQSLSEREMLEQVLSNLVSSLGATKGLVRLLESGGNTSELVVRASVGYSEPFLQQYERIPLSEEWVQRVLGKECAFAWIGQEPDSEIRERMRQSGLSQAVGVALPGRDRPLGIMAIGSRRGAKFQPDEINYLVNVANLLGLTLQNVRLFEQLSTVQQQWAYTFDSIGDPVLVHDRDFRILRSNQRLGRLLARETSSLAGRLVSELFARKHGDYHRCPYCEGVAGEGDFPDPWLPGYFLASNSTFKDAQGSELGTVHVLKDITERKRAEERYRTLVSNVQEGVFISTPQGRFLDFNDAFLRIVGYENREELLAVDIPTLFLNPADRERLKKLLQEHGAVADFEYEIRGKDGEVRAVMESSIGVRDGAGVVIAYQGFLLDITERKRAEQEIRRRNRELMVLNSIGQTLTESLDLSDSLHRSLRQIIELFQLDTASLFLIEEQGLLLRRIASAGFRSEYAKHFPPVGIQPELLQHVRAVHATFLTASALPLPSVFRDVHRKEALLSEFLVILWSKDRVIGGLTMGSRTAREFVPADINLLIAVGSQISSAIHRSLLYDEMREAYEHLRQTQEQLLHSEKMAAIGQLISGVAHELNNPLTAILGYGQLLSSSGQVGPQATEYAEKLLKQAQRTHRIVQNLLSFARQHKPERMPVQLNQVLEDTLALRDYDLRMNNIRVHLELAPDLPVTLADPYQFQQVFLNLVNNAVDAIMEQANEGDIWVRTGTSDTRVFVEFQDNGPGVRDTSRVFDPFYTTKPVGKGTGLGLSICYGIVTEHGGTIAVRNVQPHGACFTIELPCQTEISERLPGGQNPEVLGRPGTILLMDRDESVLEAVGEILRGRNHKVHGASTLTQVKSLLESERFDLIVADVEMLGKNVEASLRSCLGADYPVLAQRVVLTTASASPGEIKEIMQSGSRILQKPFKATDLLSLVEELLGQISTVER